VSPSRRSFGEALKWAMVMNSGTRGIATGVTFLLAALLGPGDFGLVAVALIYIAFVRMLLEQGFLTAIIQREHLDDEHLDSAFWLNFAWCLVLGLLSFVSAGWWASANGMPRLEGVIEVLSILIVVEGLGIVQQALMERALDFKKLALRSNLAVLLGGAVGVPLAIAGAGVWALVAQQLVLETTLLVMVWILSSWRPHLRFSRPHARELTAFSMNVFAANLAGFVNRRADALLMGIFWGPVAVGLYRLADRVVDVLLEVTMRPVGLVSLPMLSRLQNDPERLREAVAKCLRTTMLISVPLLLVVLASSHELVSVLGAEWNQAGIALQFLCLVGIGKAIGFFTGPVLFAVNRPRFRALMLWVLAAISTGTVVAVGEATRRSSVDSQVLGMSVSRAGLFLIVLVPVNLAIVSLMTGLRLRTLLPAVPGPVLSGGAAIAVATALRALGADAGPPLLDLVVVGGAAALTAAVVLIALERDVRRHLLRLLDRARGRGVAPLEEELVVEALLEPVDPSAEPFEHADALPLRTLDRRGAHTGTRKSATSDGQPVRGVG
jgi:PST family polysaccharide transporter